MDSIVIPPASASTNGFISSDNDHRGHGHHGHGHGYDRDWPERTAERVKGEVFNSERTRAEEVRDVLEAVERNGAAGSLATEKNGAAGILATNVAAGAIGVSLERIGAAGQLATNVAGQNVQNLLLAQFNLASVAAQTNVAATHLAIQVASSAALVEAVKNAGAAALTAATNQAATLAAIEECCCKQRELTRAEAEATRTVIRDIQATNLAVQLNDAKAEILSLRVRLPVAA